LTPSFSRVVELASAWKLRFPKGAKGYAPVWFTNYWVPLAFRGRYYAMVHDMLHLERDLFPASMPKRALSYLTFRHVAKSAAAISFLSRFSQREFERRFESKAQMVVASCGMDHADWQMFDPEQPPKKERRLLVVAAAKKHKNFRIAVDAFLRAKIGPEWRLTIVTPNDKLRSSIDLHEFVESGSRVGFCQGLTTAGFRDFYCSIALLVMATFDAGFGRPLTDGWKAGALCISSSAASLVEVGQGADISFCNADDLDGWVAAIEAECSRFDNGEIDHVITSRNMRHAAEFTWAEVAQKISILITGVLDEKFKSDNDGIAQSK